MPNNAIFIDEDYLKDNTPLGKNIAIEDLLPYAKTAEDKYVQEAIGTCLYNKLKSLIEASPQVFNSYEQEILLLIRDTLKWYICYDALPWIWLKPRNIGLVKQGGDNMEIASKSDLDYQRNELLNNAVFYMNRVKGYLCDNGKYFPDYKCSCGNCSDIPPNERKSVSTPLGIDRDCGDEEYQRFYKKYIRP
jgi:hypothetical protein